MLTEKDYCGQNIEDLLEEVGFPIRDYQFCLQGPGIFIKENVSLYEAQKWLREEKHIEVNATYNNIVELHWHWYMKSLINRNQTISNTNHDSYEQALLAGIKEAVKILNS